MEPSRELFFHIMEFRLSRSLFTIFFHMMEFRLSRSLSWTSLSHDGILAIMEPFKNFSFTRWNFGYHGAFRKLFFHTMEFRLSQSLLKLSRIFSYDRIQAIMNLSQTFTNFFLWWNSGYHGAFLKLSRIFFIWWNFGYHRAFSWIFFIWWNFGYHGAFSRTFLSHNGILAIMEHSRELFFYIMEFQLSWSLLANFSFT
jgi:hypothetical protein